MDGMYSLSQVNASHRGRWPEFPSQLRPDLWVGYNFIIWRDGSWLQARFIGEETAAQKGHNFDTVSISLQGRFTKNNDKPSEAQIKTLRWMMKALVSGTLENTGFRVMQNTKLVIGKTNIFPHRVLQPGTECYGTGLNDKWALDVFLDLLEAPTQPTAPAKPVVAPPTPMPASEGPDNAAWIRLMQSWQALLELWERVFGRPALGSARRKCSETDVRG